MTFSPDNVLERLAVFFAFFGLKLLLTLGPKVLVSYLGYMFLGMNEFFSYKKIFYLVFIVFIFQIFMGRILQGETYYYPLSSLFPIPLRIDAGTSWSAIIGGAFTLDVLFSVLRESKTFSGLFITIPRNAHFFLTMIVNNLIPAIFLYFATSRYLKLTGQIRNLTWLVLFLAISMIQLPPF